jgi:hypothetical protein
MNEQPTTVFQPALFPLSAVQTSGYATPEPESDTEVVADDDTTQPAEDAA